MKQKGFTIIELLLVIVIIGILAGIIIGVIDVGAQRAKALDATRVSNINKISNAINSFRVAEGYFPVDSNNNFNPFDATDVDYSKLSNYLSIWPADIEYAYKIVNKGGKNFLCVSAPMAKFDDARYFKYVTPNVPSETSADKRCGSTIVQNCQNSCGGPSLVSGGFQINLSSCETLSGEPCVNIN